MFLPEDICNGLTGLCADVPWEKTPPPLSTGGPTDHLPQLSQQYHAAEATRQAVLLFCTSLDAALSISTLRQRILHQALVNSPLSEVQSEVDPRPDLPGLVGAQCLCQDHMGKYERDLRAPLPFYHPSPLYIQDCSKPAPHFPWGH